MRRRLLAGVKSTFFRGSRESTPIKGSLVLASCEQSSGWIFAVEALTASNVASEEN